MTLDEAHLILNTKKEEPLEKILQVRTSYTETLHWADASLRHSTTSICSRQIHLQRSTQPLHRSPEVENNLPHQHIHITCSQKWFVRASE